MASMIPAPALLAVLERLPRVELGAYPSPVEELYRLRQNLGGGPTLLVKRDDAISFGFGGNKVRKLQLVAAEALAGGADTLITCGGVQSNHARATAAAAAKLGLRMVIVVNGERPSRPTGNALLNQLLRAEMHYVGSREERVPGMAVIADRLRAEGKKPFIVPLGASTPVGALGYARAVSEMLGQIQAPDVIVHAGSSGGTQAGLVAGCAINGLSTRVIAISADDPAATVASEVRRIISGIEDLLGAPTGALADHAPIMVDDSFVGPAYGISSPASIEAQSLAASTEALFVDHTYTAKALAAVIARVRSGEFASNQRILFWHTGGQVALFA